MSAGSFVYEPKLFSKTVDLSDLVPILEEEGELTSQSGIGRPCYEKELLVIASSRGVCKGVALTQVHGEIGLWPRRRHHCGLL